MAISNGEAQAQKLGQKPETDIQTIGMFTLPRDRVEVSSRSWFGGQPRMPADAEWPTVSHIDGDTQKVTIVPQHFVLQLDLTEVPSLTTARRLPASGSLLVFFDPLFSDISDDPYASPLQRGEGVKVIYHEGSPTDYPIREYPEFPDLSGISEFNISHYAQSQINYQKHSIIFENYKTSRTFDKEMFGYRVDQDNVTVGLLFLERLKRDDIRLEDLGVHQIFGVTSRDYIPVKAFFEGLPPKALPANCNPLDDDHSLLFSFRSDPNVGFPDHGSQAYGFWIKESDLEKQNFENVVVWREFE